MKAKTILLAVLGILTLCGSAWAMDGMVSYWKFDDGSGATAYDLFGDNHGTVYGAQWTSGQVEGALTFDGVDDYVDIPDTVKNYLETSYTFSAWLKPKTITGIHGIAAYRRSTSDIGYQILLQLQHNNSDVQFIVGSLGNNAVASYPNALTTNTWYHIAGVREGNILNVYVNGVSGIPDSETFGTISPDNFKIGANHCCGHAMTSFFDGSIDEIAIYDRALSVEEIQQHYENGLAGYGYPVDAKIFAINRIERAIAEKLETLEKVNATLEQEWAAYEALQELLESGIYGDLSKGDIVTAMQKTHSSIQHEEQSIDALEKSIEKLQDALAALGWEPPQPVSHWKFDEGSGTTAYDSVGTNDGIVYGATWTTGQVDGALSFDGMDDYVRTANNVFTNAQLASGATLSAWFNTDSTAHCYIADNEGYLTLGVNHIYAPNPNKLCGIVDGGHHRFFSSSDVTDNLWHHAAIVWDGTDTAILYLDGLNVSSGHSGPPTPDRKTRPFTIGAHSTIAAYFNGTIDDVMIFDIALSAQEIQQLYNNALAGW